MPDNNSLPTQNRLSEGSPCDAISDFAERIPARFGANVDIVRDEVKEQKATNPEFRKRKISPPFISFELDCFVKTFIAELRFQNRRAGELLARVAELEARPQAKYVGVFQSDEAPYEEGEFVTHQGSLWYCHETTSAVPGQSQAWQLAVKRGRAG